MTEVTINDITYRIGTLNAFKQLHVVRRVVPLLTTFMKPETIRMLNPKRPEGTPAPTQEDVLGLLLEPFVNAMAAMSDDDCEYIVRTCLAVVNRKVGSTFTLLISANGSMMYDDMDLPTTIRLVWEVLRANLSGFFSALPSTSQGAPTL